MPISAKPPFKATFAVILSYDSSAIWHIPRIDIFGLNQFLSSTAKQCARKVFHNSFVSSENIRSKCSFPDNQL